MIRKFWPNWNFRKVWTKSRYFENLPHDWDFHRYLPKIAIFVNFGQIPDTSKIFTSIKIFHQKVWPKSRLTDIWTKIEIFRIKSRFTKDFEIFTNFVQNRFFFSKILSQTVIFKNFDRNRGILKGVTKSGTFKHFDQNRYFSIILTKIQIFHEFHQNRDEAKILTKVGIFRKFCLKSILSTILSKIEVFRKSSQKSRFSKFWSKSRYFENLDFIQDISKIMTKIEIFRYLDHNRDVSNKIEIYRRFWIFHQFWPKSLFFENFSKT